MSTNRSEVRVNYRSRDFLALGHYHSCFELHSPSFYPSVRLVSHHIAVKLVQIQSQILSLISPLSHIPSATLPHLIKQILYEIILGVQ